MTDTITTTDPRVLFHRAVATGEEVVAALTPAQLALPTPCDDFDVRGLLVHLLVVLDRVGALAEGGDPWAIEVPEVADDAFAATWRDLAAGAENAWRDDDVLDRVITLPWAQQPGRVILLSYVSEVLVHLWDIAQATGQRPQWDDEAVAGALAAMHEMLPAGDRLARFHEVVAQMPADMRPTTPPFAEAVDVPASAPLIDRLVAWNGRRP